MRLTSRDAVEQPGRRLRAIEGGQQLAQDGLGRREVTRR
jgi:hypothetical protein